MNVFALRNQLITSFASYVKSFIHLSDERIERYILGGSRNALIHSKVREVAADFSSPQFCRMPLDVKPDEIYNVVPVRGLGFSAHVK